MFVLIRNRFNCMDEILIFFFFFDLSLLRRDFIKIEVLKDIYLYYNLYINNNYLNKLFKLYRFI